MFWKEVMLEKNDKDSVLTEYNKFCSAFNVIPDYFLYFNNLEKSKVLSLFDNLKKIGANEASEITLHNKILLDNLDFEKLENEIKSVIGNINKIDLLFETKNKESVTLYLEKISSENPSINISVKEVRYLRNEERNQNQDRMIEERTNYFTQICKTLGLDISFIKSLKPYDNEEKQLNALLLNKFMDYKICFVGDALGDYHISIRSTKGLDSNIIKIFFDLVKNNKSWDFSRIAIRARIPVVEDLLRKTEPFITGVNGEGRYTFLDNILYASKINKEVKEIMPFIDFEGNQELFGFNSHFKIEGPSDKLGKVEFLFQKGNYHLMIGLEFDDAKDMEQKLYSVLGYKLI